MWASLNSLVKRRAPAPHRVLKRILRPWIDGELGIPGPKKIGNQWCWVHPRLLTAEPPESHVVAWIQKCVSPGQTFFDVGAHYGWMSLIAAHSVGPTGRVIAFEPAPPLVGILRYHKRVNRLTQMHVMASAVSDMDCNSVSFMVMNDGFSVGNSLVRHELDGRTSESAVRTITLDSYCALNNCWPHVVKIDVEGAELLVLRSAAAVVSRNRPTLIVAVHPPWLPNGQTAADLFDLAASYGYRLQDSRVYPYKGQEFGDYLFSCESAVTARSGTTLKNINADAAAVSAASKRTLE